MKTRGLKKIGLFFVFSILICGPLNAWAADERIAVAADGRDTDAEISDIAARAPFILIFGAEQTLIGVHPNPVSTDRGAGPALAGWLADKQVHLFIAGRIGAKLAPALEAHKIKTVVMNGKVSEALTAVKK